MSTEYEADGERWDVYLSREEPHPGVGAVIFHCESNSSEGWRVVEVPAADYREGRLDTLSTSELGELYRRAQPFDFVHDPKAHAKHIGEGGTR